MRIRLHQEVSPVTANVTTFRCDPARDRADHSPALTQAPPAIVAIVSAPIDADRVRMIARTTLSALSLEQAKADALTLLDFCAEQTAGRLDVELQDRSGCPLFTASRTGGAS